MLTRHKIKNKKDNIINIDIINPILNKVKGSKKRKEGVKKYLASLKNAKFN